MCLHAQKHSRSFLVIKFGHVLSGSIAICTIDPLQCLVACLVLGKKGTLKAACVFKVLNGSSMCLRSICLLVRENIIIILQRYIRTCWLCGIIHIARFSVEKKNPTDLKLRQYMCRIDILPTDPYCCTVYIMCICLPVVREWRSMKALRCTLQIVLFLCICTLVTSEDQCNLTLKTGKYAWGDKVVQEYILIYYLYIFFFFF